MQAVGSSKVALMFLTRGSLHHEQSWRLWFRSAAGILPIGVAAPPSAQQSSGGGLCSLDGDALDTAREACTAPIESDDAISYQHLFSVYIHLSADVDGKK